MGLAPFALHVDIDYVRRQLDDLCGARELHAFDDYQAARYRELCTIERVLLSSPLA